MWWTCGRALVRARCGFGSPTGVSATTEASFALLRDKRDWGNGMKGGHNKHAIKHKRKALSSLADAVIEHGRDEEWFRRLHCKLPSPGNATTSVPYHVTQHKGFMASMARGSSALSEVVGQEAKWWGRSERRGAGVRSR